MRYGTLLFSSPRLEAFDAGAEGIFLTCDNILAGNIVLRTRARELRRVLRRAIRRHLGPASAAPDGTCAFRSVPETSNALFDALPRIDRSLMPIVERPLTGTAVQDLLGISARERKQWTADGRLPTQGVNLVRNGQMLALPTYAPDVVANLLADATLIEGWRRQG